MAILFVFNVLRFQISFVTIYLLSKTRPSKQICCQIVAIDNIYIVTKRPPGGVFRSDIQYPSGPVADFRIVPILEGYKSMGSHMEATR